MVEKSQLGVKNPFFGRISADLITAKNSLRDQLTGKVEKAVPQALALRRKKSFSTASGVNLVGVGIGEKVTNRKRTGEMCVKVLVAKKYPKGRIGRPDSIPSAIEGIPTDIEAVGYPRKFEIPNRQLYRPVPGGVSVGLDFNAVNYRFAGTLGVIVSGRETPQRFYALSNNHVLADENRVATGAGVVQPGTLDQGTNPNRVARLTQYVPLKFDNRRNWMDAAVAEFDRIGDVTRMILGIGAPQGSANPTLSLIVRKSGRTTGLTEGVVRAVRFDVFGIQYDQGLVRVDDVIVIEGISGSFSKPGDSGSAIVDPQGRVVALLFAGSDAVTYAIPIDRILRRFKAKIAT
jgi:hypothetical protein